MTREELKERLGFEAEVEAEGFQYGVDLETSNDAVSLLLIRQSHLEPYSVYTAVEMPGEQEWKGPTELWEVVWQTHYQVVVAEYTHRPLQPGEDPRDYPQPEDYCRCESYAAGTLDGLGQFLSSYGKSLADVKNIFPLRPPLRADTQGDTLESNDTGGGGRLPLRPSDPRDSKTDGSDCQPACD